MVEERSLIPQEKGQAVRAFFVFAVVLFLVSLGAACSDKSSVGGGTPSIAFVGTVSIGAVSSEISITMRRDIPRGEAYRDLEIAAFSAIASLTSQGATVLSEQRTDVFVFVHLDGSEPMVIPARNGAEWIRLVPVATPIGGGDPVSMNEVSFDPRVVTRLSVSIYKK